MKKYGFTLAELMIALGIIAVAAVIAAPALSDMMPQKDKIRVIKYTVMMDDATNELLSNKSLYHSTKYTGIVSDQYGNRSLDYSNPNFSINKIGTNECIGLECTHAPDNFTGSASDKARYTGENKFKNLLSDKLGLKNNKLPDGSEWTISTDMPAQITIDLDGSKKGKNCHFPLSFMDKTGCQKPDIFMFTIDKFGTVSGDDPLTKAYLANPLNMHDKKKDFETAGRANIHITRPPKRP